jgi:signal transduction histidine kinase
VTTASRARHPLARRVRLALLAVGAVCIVVTAGVFYALWAQQMLAARLTELTRQVGVVASGVAVSDALPGSAQDVDGARERLLKVEAGLLGVRFSVADATGTVLFSTAGASSVASYPVASFARGADAFAARTAVLDLVGVGRVAVVAIPVSFESPGHPSRYLVGARTLSDLASADRLAGMAVIAALAAGLMVAVLLGASLTRGITGPLMRLTEGARAITRGDWGRQVPMEGADEVTDLAGAFNEMSARVADAYHAQQEFVSDVSHELRTPVTSIRGFADAIVDGTVCGDEATKHAATVISSEAESLAELTTSLLALADLDAGRVEFAREQIDAAALGSTLRDRFGAIALSTGRDLQVEELRGRPVGDLARLLQAVSALVDNALRHAPARGHVRVSSDVAEGTWTIAVDDDGPGVPVEDRERVFGRFTRLDASRGKGGGSGLGLAICRRVIELMGGRVSVGDSPILTGARFVVELPATEGASTRTQRAYNSGATSAPDTHDGGA